MNKSVYSLVLTDSVVKAADRMAYRKGMSRSALIDEILAQALSCMTPEMRMRDIFVSLEELMRDNRVFKLQTRGSDSMLSLLAALQYKYKPTIRYSIELYRQMQNHSFGVLKIQSRTQNEQLTADLEYFYRFWVQAEHAAMPQLHLQYHLTDNRLTRELTLPPQAEGCSESELAAAISCYIQYFDKGMKLWFEALPDHETAQQAVRAVLAEYMRQCTFTV